MFWYLSRNQFYKFLSLRFCIHHSVVLTRSTNWKMPWLLSWIFECWCLGKLCRTAFFGLLGFYIIGGMSRKSSLLVMFIISSVYFVKFSWSWLGTWQFVPCSLITNNCYKLLENQNVTKNKAVRDAIFQILGVMVKRFNHTIGLSTIFLISMNVKMYNIWIC